MDEKTQVSETQSEVVEEPEGQLQDEPESQFDDWDKEKSVEAYRNLQKKITERDKEAKRERQEREKLEKEFNTLKEQISSPKEETRVEAPPKPKPLPPKPQGFSMADVYDESTVSAEWWNKKLDYDIQKAEFDEWRDQQATEYRKKEAAAKKTQQEQAQFKNKWIDEAQNSGYTLQEAMAGFDFLLSEKSTDPKFGMEYFKHVNGKPKKPETQKPQSTQSPTTVGTGNEEQVDRQQFTKSSDHSWMYKPRK